MQKGDEGDLTLLEALINDALSESLFKIETIRDIKKTKLF